MKQIGKSATAVQGDVSNLADLDRLYATVKQQKGHIDILFANAGTGEFALLGAISRNYKLESRKRFRAMLATAPYRGLSLSR